ncbi:MAG TPA: hypothetical protein VMQ65_10050 [Candidatus Limnocylindria bacterium]|nr:hypothetical protein [Candidatus Limnocylindria bacterium]
MEHSITARYAARPAAHFPRASSGSRQRRLGLGVGRAFSPAPTRLTVLLRDQPSPLVRLRRDPRSIAATRPVRHSSGRLRPPFTLTWGGSLAPRRPSANAAPWRA